MRKSNKIRHRVAILEIHNRRLGNLIRPICIYLAVYLANLPIARNIGMIVQTHFLYSVFAIGSVAG